jgi:hypothetical protein
MKIFMPFLTSVMLYSSSDPVQNDEQAIDADSYPPFRIVNASVIQHIMEEMDRLCELEEEREFVCYKMGASLISPKSTLCIGRGCHESSLLWVTLISQSPQNFIWK